MQNAQYAAHEAENYDSSEPDSLFGICQAAGEDLGIDPFLLRVALIGLLFFSPLAMIGAYVGLGVVVGASRLLFPKPGNVEPVREPAVVVQNEQHSQPIRQEPELIAA
jgi:phage shock protein PspC (stress-responsive transcriptional regulator)